MNNKGFTFVEILAVIAIIGILSGIDIVGVSRYRETAKNKDYEALAKSSYNAMEEYIIAHPYKKKASLEKLAKEDFLSNRTDPATKSSDCTGSVEVDTIENGRNGKMDKNEYTVYLCCYNYKKKYIYPSGEVDDYNGNEKCDIEEDDSAEIIPGPTPSTPGPYNLTYDDNNGSGCSNNTITKNGNEEWGTLCKPSRKGYTFKEWNTKKDSSGEKITSTSKATKNIKVYAIWSINKVYIKINANGGKLATTHGSAYTLDGNVVKKNGKDIIHEVEYNASLSSNGLINYNYTQALNLEKSGYGVVSGKEWNTTADGTGTSYSQEKVYSAKELCSDIDTKSCTITLYVYWQANKTVTVSFKFKSNYGNLPLHSSNTTEKCSTIGNENCSITFPRLAWEKSTKTKCRKTYNSFFDMYWNTKADGTGTDYKDVKTYDLNQNLTLYPKIVAHEEYVKKNDVLRVDGWACEHDCDNVCQGGEQNCTNTQPVVFNDNFTDRSHAIKRGYYFYWDGRWKYEKNDLFLHGHGTTKNGDTSVRGGACHNSVPTESNCYTGWVRASFIDHPSIKCPNSKPIS